MITFGKHLNYQDVGRMLWKSPPLKQRLLVHCMHVDHPHAQRFRSRTSLVERILESICSDKVLDIALRDEVDCLLFVMREVPPVFWKY